MKIKSGKGKFSPVTVTFETKKELMLLVRMYAATENEVDAAYYDSCGDYLELEEIATKRGIDVENTKKYPYLCVTLDS